MSLRKKFILLLSLLALTSGVSVAASFWAARLLERELARPFARITSALSELHTTKREVWSQARLILGDEAPAITIPQPDAGRAGAPSASPPPEEFRDLGEQILGRFGSLANNDAFIARAGLSAWRNMRERAERAQVTAARWWDAGDVGARSEAATELLALHELIERAESGVLHDAAIAADYGSGLRRRVNIALALALGTGLATAGFAAIRLKRWVLAPVNDLRVAASRIAEGDFAHRVPDPADAGGSGGAAPTNDELALLAREVNHMAGMVSTMQEERVARERLAAVGEMARRLAHNLRNPLSGIRALAEDSRSDLPPDSDIRERQSRIITTVDRFERWLRDLLATTSPLEVQPTTQAVGPWLTRVAEALTPMAEARGVSLRVRTEQAPAEATFDARHLEQALVALLTNAVQASPPESPVVMWAEHDRDRWRVLIADSGPGVPDELIHKIFDAHFTTKPGGSGMGLALCRQVVLEHGGTVSVVKGEQPAPGEAQPGFGAAGAVFSINLPLRARTRATDGVANGAHGGENSDHRG